MSVSEAQKRATRKWTQANIKRIPLDVRKEYYEEKIVPAARRAGESVNGYIKKAVADRISREQTGGE